MSCVRRDQAEAFAAGAIQGESLESFKQHLATCSRCAETVRLASGSRGLLSGLAAYEPSEIELRRIDRAVVDSFKRPVGAPRFNWALASVPLAVAAVVVALIFRPTASQPTPLPPPAQALVVASGGEAFVTTPRGTRPVAALSTVSAGDRIQTRSGEVVLQTGPATGLRVRGSSEVELKSLSTGHAEVYLERGEVIAEVKKAATPGFTAFAVRTADLTVSVRGTAFRVLRGSGETLVEVAHGTVALERGRDELLLSATQHATVKDGEALEHAVREAGVSNELTQALPLGIPDATVDEVARERRSAAVTSEPAGARVEVDDVYRGPTPLSTIESTGPHRMRVAVAGAEPAETTLDTATPAAHHVALAPSKHVSEPKASSSETSPSPPRHAPAKEPASSASTLREPDKEIAALAAPEPSIEKIRVVGVEPSSSSGRPLTRASVDDWINRNLLKPVQDCGQEYLLAEVRERVAVHIKFRVSQSGTMADLVIGDESSLPKFGACIREAAGRLRLDVQGRDASAVFGESFERDLALRPLPQLPR